MAFVPRWVIASCAVARSLSEGGFSQERFPIASTQWSRDLPEYEEARSRRSADVHSSAGSSAPVVRRNLLAPVTGGVWHELMRSGSREERAAAISFVARGGCVFCAVEWGTKRPLVTYVEWPCEVLNKWRVEG